MHSASTSIPCIDAAEARLLHDAIAIEMDEGPEGTTAAVSIDGSTLVMDFQASDVSGLRAALHSALRLLDAAQRTASVAPAPGGKD